MKAIKTTNLTKSYGKARGIMDINLSVEKGDFFGFIGPNGAGKSTTIRTLLGLISPDSGNAALFGKDITAHKKELLSDIGYLPSETAFYHGMKVKDILQFSADLHKKDCSIETKQLCDRLELDTSRKIDQLSLGNRKKVGIVCAMQHKPSLYIMDEPTSGLDPLMQHEFYCLLSERNQEGATVFLSSHVLSEVQKYCKHAAVIREGRLLVSDSVERLSATGTKQIVLSGITDFPPLETIKNQKKTQNGISFLYSGNLTLLLKTLAGLPITDIMISEPDLEEIFMHYYIKEL